MHLGLGAADGRSRADGSSRSLGGRIVDAYSITEAMNAAIINPVDRPPRPGAIGVPLPDVELRIAVPATGDEDVRDAGEDGELLMRAPQLMTGYWGRPAETAEMIVDGWLHTGDIGHLDDDGYVHVVDRRKDMIKPGGYAVWPREVEEVIAAHPDVVEVGVAGVPDRAPGRGGQGLGRAACRQRSCRPMSIRNWTRERLAPYKVPRVRSSFVIPCRGATSARCCARISWRTPNGPRMSIVER